MSRFEAECKFAFYECYSRELLDHLSRKSGIGSDLVETMYQSFASGYFAAMAEHYKGDT